MKRLLKQYDLNSDMQYFEMIVESFTNGQRKQAFSQFSAMSKQYRKDFVRTSLTYWESGLSNDVLAELIDLI